MKSLKKSLAVVAAMLFSIIALTACGGKTKMDESLIQFGQSDKIIDETVMLVSENGQAAYGYLLFAPTKVESVKRYFNPASGQTQVFKKDVDYKIEGNKITAISDAIPTVTQEMLDGSDATTWEVVDYKTIKTSTAGKFLPFTESYPIVAMQLSVTYKYNKGDYKGDTVNAQTDKLSKTIEKLKNGEKVEMFVYGDSVATGANASSILDIPPMLEIWPNLVATNLSEMFKGSVNVTNKSVGAWRSTEGVNGGIGWIHGVQVNQKGIKTTLDSLDGYSPDVALIHFGLNDGAAGIAITQEAYEKNIKTMITEIRKKNADCEIILINPHKANPLAIDQSTPIQAKFIENLQNISNSQNDIAIVDIAKIHEYILETKRYIDTTANGVNHPNDYITRVYASAILGLFE